MSRCSVSAIRHMIFRSTLVMRVMPNAIRLGPGNRWCRRGVLGLSVALAATVLAAPAALGQTAQQVDPQIRDLFTRAQGVFASADQAESVSLFTELIAILDARAVDEPLSEPHHEVLVEGLSYRAEAQFNLGETTEAADDLRRVVGLDPSFQLDANQVSSRLLELFDGVYSEMVGVLNLEVFPREAVTLVDAELVDALSGPISLLAGPHTVVVQRPGFTEVREEVEIEPAVQAELSVFLERSSAVLYIFTQPAGVLVSVDSEPVGETTGAASAGAPLRGFPSVPRQEFSEALVLPGLARGSHEVELTIEGYRGGRSEISVPGLEDYELAFLLEPARGWVLLEGLPDEVTVSVDGTEVTPEPPDDPSLPAVPGLELPPGDHTISIVDSRASVFEETVSVVDRGSLVVPVLLRPAIALLGILGGDEIGAAKLRTALEQADGELEQWAILSREEQSGTVLEQAGVTAESLRQLASVGRVDATLVDWEAVQAAVGQYTSASLYMVGVLSDDLVASYADFWVWLPAPWPTLPARVRVGIDDGSAEATIKDAFAAELILRRRWLGAILIDSDAAAGPVVTRLAEEGPAARAGLLVGDVISAIGAQRVETAAAAGERLSALDPGVTVTLAVIRNGRAETVEVLLGSSPSVPVPAGSTALYPAVLTLLTRRLETGDTSEPAWVVQLNQAAVLMQAGAWEQAVDTLRQIPDAPTGPGLGRAAVDYWFGMAASALSPGYYDIARAAFSRTASVPGATLFHNDGPLVAPRARARLQLLGGPSPPQ